MEKLELRGKRNENRTLVNSNSKVPINQDELPFVYLSKRPITKTQTLFHTNRLLFYVALPLLSPTAPSDK